MRYIVLFLMLFTLQGCTAGLAVAAMNGFGACSPADFKAKQNILTHLHTIQTGETESRVIKKLGSPEKQSVVRTKWGSLMRVLHFRTDTEHCRNYGGESVPVITENGRVRGVGLAYYDAIKLERAVH